MSKALREQKCLSPSTACAGADEAARAAAHDVGFAGLLVDLAQRRRAADRADEVAVVVLREDVRPRRRPAACRATTSRICGMTSPARCTTTVSPTRTSSRAISSSLCSAGVGDDDAADGDRLAAWRPASARRCGRPGSRSPRRSSSRARPGTCGRPPSAGCARRSRAAAAARGRRPCRRRRRCRSRGSRAAPRWRGNGRASPPAERHSLVSGLTGRPKRWNASIAPFCVAAKGSLTSPQA